MDVAAETREPSKSPLPEESADASSTQPESQPDEAAADNKFQQAISSWRNIDLTKLVPTLDTTASDLVAQQRDALVERKELAQKTKDFRKLDDSSKLVEVKALLKAYQTYIDLVTNQSKTVHNSFLHVYSLLSEAPDPYPLLEASVDSLVTVDETVPRLEAENKHLQSTNKKLSSQLEDVEARLQTEISARQKIQDQSESRVKDVEASWSAVLTEKQDNWSAREKSLEDRVESQERLVKELKASYEVSQRLGKGDDSETSQAGVSAAELEILNSDLERANNRLAELEARNEQLRLEVAQKATSASAEHKVVPVDEDPAYQRLRSENFSLMRKVEDIKFEKGSRESNLDSNIRALRREIAGLTEDRNVMKTKLDRRQDYEDVKRELEVLKSIEFSTGENDETAEGYTQPAQESPEDNGSGGQALEKLLMGRNKKLNNELTVLRVSHQDLARQLEEVRAQLNASSPELDKLRQLNATLENDLSNIQNEAVGSGAAMSVAGTYTPRIPGGSLRRGRVSPTSSIISGFDGPRGGGDGYGGGSGMLPMITAQRDRFKKRITELETESAKTYQTVSSLRSEIAALQKDNLNLYEKTRYVSSYGRGQPVTAGTALNPNPSTVQMPENGNVGLDRYKSAYESRISPFAAFRGHESMRALKRMSLPERAFLQATKATLANRMSRNLFALYFLGLHLVIIGMLYTSTGSSQHATAGQLAQRAAAIAKTKDSKG